MILPFRKYFSDIELASIFLDPFFNTCCRFKKNTFIATETFGYMSLYMKRGYRCVMQVYCFHVGKGFKNGLSNKQIKTCNENRDVTCISVVLLFPLTQSSFCMSPRNLPQVLRDHCNTRVFTEGFRGILKIASNICVQYYVNRIDILYHQHFKTTFNI